MPSETIWSNPGGSAASTTPPQLQSVLDQVDPSVARYFANTSAMSDSHDLRALASDNGRRFSFNDRGDMAHPLFGIKKSSIQPLTGSSSYVGNPNGLQAASANASPAGATNRMNFGTVSISGGIASRHPPQESFFRKFQSVAEATRDLELNAGMQNMGIGHSGSTPDAAARKLSLTYELATQKPPPQHGLADVLSSPHGSINESLNMPASRTSRHQSISEKIDNYNNNSPIQAAAVLSTPSDLSSSHHTNVNSDGDATPSVQHHPHLEHKAGVTNFWNPATATSFIPGGGNINVAPPPNYFIDNGMLFGYRPPPGQSLAVNDGTSQPTLASVPPPFMVPSPPPPPFMDPGMYEMMYNQAMAASGEKDDGALNALNELKGDEDSSKQNIPGIGLMSQNTAFVLPQFNPYAIYPGMAGFPIGSPPPPSTQAAPPPPQMGHTSSPGKERVSSPPQKVPPSNGKRNGGKGGKHLHGGGSNAPKSSGLTFATGGSTGGIYRSPLLEEVRANFKGKDYQLKDIYGHAIEFTKDQHGSRFIQQQLPLATDEEKEVIFNEIRDLSFDLMTDVFGNYVIQKYFEFGSKTQKNILLEYMIGHIYDLSLQMYGCRVVQRALEAISLKDQIRIIDELRDCVLICAKDQNGNHVIQKLIEKIPFDNIRFILEALDNQIYHLSTHPYGCRVIQRLLEYSNEEDQEKILLELNRFIFYLIQDQYGNYVMQHILERGKIKDREEILKVVLGSVVQFSKHKFASNVIEKCIKFGTLDQRKRILHEVMIDNESLDDEGEKAVVSDGSPLALMMKDQYANYVIQKLVEGFDAKSNEKKLLVLKLRQYLKQISSKNSYGKHLASVEKMIIVAETALVDAEKTN